MGKTESVDFVLTVEMSGLPGLDKSQALTGDMSGGTCQVTGRAITCQATGSHRTCRLSGSHMTCPLSGSDTAWQVRGSHITWQVSGSYVACHGVITCQVTVIHI